MVVHKTCGQFAELTQYPQAVQALLETIVVCFVIAET